MTALRLRHRVRAIADELKPGEVLVLGQIFQRLPGRKPEITNLAWTIAEMADAGQLERLPAPKGSGRGVKHAYRSGPKPVTDGRVNCGQRQRQRYGFMALRKLEEKNPAEWARITDGGRL